MYSSTSIFALLTTLVVFSEALGAPLNGLAHKAVTIPLKSRRNHRNIQRAEPIAHNLPLNDAFNGTDLQVGKLDKNA
jgi:hypothetical protein